MTWSIEWSCEANKFLVDSHLAEETITTLIRNSLLKFQGEEVNISISKLHGEWVGFHRIRKGKLRIIVEFIFERRVVHIEVIDWRGSVYK